MGEAAQDILDGIVCECCGEWMDDMLHRDGPIDVPGYPRRCEACEAPKPKKKKRGASHG